MDKSSVAFAQGHDAWVLLFDLGKQKTYEQFDRHPKKYKKSGRLALRIGERNFSN